MLLVQNKQIPADNARIVDRIVNANLGVPKTEKLQKEYHIYQ